MFARKRADNKIMEVETPLELKEVWRERQDAARVKRAYTWFKRQFAQPNARGKLRTVLGPEGVGLLPGAAV